MYFYPDIPFQRLPETGKTLGIEDIYRDPKQMGKNDQQKTLVYKQIC